MPGSQLPDYERPPVQEIIAAVQFVPVPRFAMAEVVAVARVFDDWSVVDAPTALPPIVEPPPGAVGSVAFDLGIGTPPSRLILSTPDGGWLLQIQQDRIAVHERRIATRPSFSHVEPKLNEVVGLASSALGVDLLSGAAGGEIVELTYVNVIPSGEGWSGFHDLHRVLSMVAAPPTEGPTATIEQTVVGTVAVLEDNGAFAGRLRIHADPMVDDTGAPGLQLRLISRRYVHERPVGEVMAQCHRDIVQGFTDVTTKDMHMIWGRFR